MSAMKKRKEHVSKDEAHLTISSTDGLGENSGTMPIDLIVEILFRLLAKSVVRSRCVSKNWNSLIRNPYFTNLLLTRSSARPRLFFTIQAEGKWSFFSLPEYLISDNNSSLVVVDSHTDVPKGYSFRVCVPVCGLTCTKEEWVLIGRRDARMMVCNPITGKFKSLPKARSSRGEVSTYIGYDSTEKQHNVLGMTTRERPFMYKAEEYQVLTLGTGELKWRKIECSVAHYPLHREISINGVLYYLALYSESRKVMIVCFHVKHETFNFIVNKASMDLCSPSTLIDYKGKLGEINHSSIDFMDGGVASFELWVIDDIEEHTWSRHIHILPPLWKELVAKTSYSLHCWDDWDK